MKTMKAPIMKFMFHWPIRPLLVMLVVISLLPVMAVMFYSGVKNYDQAVQEAQDNSLRTMQTIAQHQNLIAESTRQLLATLARMPEIQRLDVEASSRFFRQLLSQNPMHANILLVDLGGTIIASALPSGSRNVADRKYFKDVLRTRDLSTGEHVVGLVVQRPVFHFAYPVLDHREKLKAVVVAGLDLAKYDAIPSGSRLPEDSVLAFSDHRGMRLYRYPENDRYAGQPDLSLMQKHMSGESDEGTFTEAGVDGTRRFYAYKRLRLREGEPPYLYMRLGIPEDRVLSPVWSEIKRNLLLTGYILLAALALAWFLGGILVRNPVNRLISVTNRFRTGERGARTGLPHTGSELGRLTRSFDDLYEDLENREREQGQAESLVRDSRRRLSEIIDFLPDATLVVDKEGRVIAWNRAIEAMTGINGSDMIGRGDYEYAIPFYGERRPILIDLALHPDLEKEKRYTTIRRTGEMLFGEAYTPNLPSGSRHLSATASVLRGADGEIVAAIECIRDNTERRKLEEMLVASEKRYRNLVDNTPVGVYQAHLDGRILYANEGLAEIVESASVQALTGFTVARFYRNQEDRKHFIKTINECGAVKNCELELVTLKGHIKHVLINGVLEGEQILGTINDITELRRVEEDRRKLEERLRRSEKMESLGVLAGGVAHDLNNVLGILVGYSELLGDEIDGKSPLRSHVEYIRQGGQRAAAIVQDLLTMARRGVQTREVVDLNAVISGFHKTPEFEKICSFHPGVRVETRIEAALLNIQGSPVHLSKTLMNLVSNAAEAMPAGGLITIRTGNEYLDRPVAGYDDVREGDYVVLSVTDTGEGISPADMERIFEPFYTKKVMGRSGTGLGLAVVWGTVKDHDGYIHVHSEPGKGTTFSLYFPVTREEVVSKQDLLPLSEYLGKGESVLVVDDVQGQRELAARMLTKLNYSVAMVAGGEAAVEYLKTREVDLVVLDMIMDPGIDGLETYSRIREIHPGQKAIIVSGFAETDRVHKAQELGAGACIKKPYAQERLGLAVRDELRRW